MIRSKSDDHEIWMTDYCGVCDNGIPRDEEEILIKHFVGGHGHRIYVGYHPACYVEYELFISFILADKDYRARIEKAARNLVKCMDA